MQRLSVYGETMVTMSVRDTHFDSDYTITSENGLKFAIAIIDYDSNPEPIDDPRYGKITAKTFSWGFGDTQGTAGGYMGLHRCTPDELFNDSEDPSSDDTPYGKFFPIHSNSLKDVKLYQKKLWCIDEDVILQGDYNSDKAKVLKLSFEKCNDETYVPEFRRRDLNGTAVSH